MKYFKNDLPGLVFSYYDNHYFVKEVYDGDKCWLIRIIGDEWEDRDFPIHFILEYLEDGSYKIESKNTIIYEIF